MTNVGQKERATQNRIITLLKDQLGYSYLGNWEDRPNNSNIEEAELRKFLSETQGYSELLIARALFELNKIAGDQTKSLYDVNKEIYRLLRYGIKIKESVGENKQTVWLVNWNEPQKNNFGVAEEVSVTVNGKYQKRPDLVLYVNGIALGILEMKRSSVAVNEGIRQNLDSQRKEFIERFFGTMQLVMAGNDTEGIRYGTIQTPEKYYLTWKEDSSVENRLDRHVLQICSKERFLELIHNFTVFDSGTKKLCRHNQYFGVRAAQDFIRRREGGIIWHTQGSGKSLTMVWLAKWIRENVKDSRVLIITDRTELDEQIEKVFTGIDETIYRTKSGADLVGTLNATVPNLICSIIHKFGGVEDDEEVGDISAFIADLNQNLPKDFRAKGHFYVFVDECHRTQSGLLHAAMKALLPNAVFIGFTGTPLLKKDKKKTLEVFGRYIHTYKFDEGVRDKVILDLRYEARDIDQKITSQAKIDQWFEAKTKALTDLAKAQLKQRWGTMQKVLSCQDRLEKIVADVMMDMATRPRLMDGRGNAMLVSASIYQACKYYELFVKSGLGGKCAIVTSYKPSHRDIKGEETGEGLTEKLRQYEIYRKMLADWFNESEDKAMNRVEEFEKAVKKKFIDEPGQMKLLIVVDKLLTGFDAPSATYLYIDKEMHDHGLFQAICRVNRLDGEDKDYGYIIDYKDLFKSLERSIKDYTVGGFEGFDPEDVAGLLDDRLEKAKQALDDAREAVKALCEDVEAPKDQAAYFRYFSTSNSGNATQLKDNEAKRLALYKHVAAFVRSYANIANEMSDAGYSAKECQTIKEEVQYYEALRDEIKKHSGDAIDLKAYEPAMRHLIDTYIRAEESRKISAFDDMSLVQLIVERGPDAVDALPDGIRKNEGAVAETIENNVRKLIVEQTPINPKYYEKMSQLLDALIEARRRGAENYQKYLQKLVDLTRKAMSPASDGAYPVSMNTPARRTLYDNLGKNEGRALAVDTAVRVSRQDGWRGNDMKIKKVRIAIETALEGTVPTGTSSSSSEGAAETPQDYEVSVTDALVDRVLELVKNQNEY